MDRKIPTTIILVIAIAVVGFLAGQSQGSFASPEHQSIIDSMVITDTKLNVQLQPFCVASRIVTWNKQASIVSMAIFEDNRDYPQSTWLWQRFGDTELVMTIWGPGEDQTSCLIEIARLGADPFQVKIKGEVHLTILEAIGSPAEGYYHLWLEVT